MSKRRTRVTIALLAVFSMIGLVLLRAFSNSELSRLEAAFDSIRPGMLAKEVEAILGPPSDRFAGLPIELPDESVRDGEGMGWLDEDQFVYVMTENGFVTERILGRKRESISRVLSRMLYD